MPLIFRKLRKAKWYKNSNVPWLTNGELQADALGDLKTDSNTLSVYYVEDGKSNLERIITALAATGDTPSSVDYALIDALILNELGILNLPNPGKTPDDTVNHWHQDLIELTAGKLYHLAQAIQTKADIKREPEKNIRKLLMEGILTEQLDKKVIKSEMLNSLGL